MNTISTLAPPCGQNMSNIQIFTCNIKGIVHQKILSSFTNPHLVPNLYEFISSVSSEDILKNVGIQTLS